MLSLIKSKARKQDGSRAGNGKLGKRSRSLISRPIEVLTSANLNKLQQQQQQQQENLQSQVCFHVLLANYYKIQLSFILLMVPWRYGDSSKEN